MEEMTLEIKYKSIDKMQRVIVEETWLTAWNDKGENCRHGNFLSSTFILLQAQAKRRIFYFPFSKSNFQAFVSIA